MKKKELRTTSHRLSLGLLVTVLLLLAGCSKEKETNRLPEGKYLLTFTTATQGENTPKTRVSETDNGNGSTWTDGDEIAVSIDNGTQTGKYTLNADGTIKQTITPLYWQNTDEATVDGWYPATDGTVDLSDQSSGLKYVLKGTGTGSYQNAPQLAFAHQLAKVRVDLKIGTYEGDDLSNATVTVKGHTSCTVSSGTVTGSGSADSYITMMKTTYNGATCYEANVVPGTLNEVGAFRIIRGSKSTKINLNSDVNLLAGNVHKITLTVNKKQPPTEIILTEQTSNPLTVGDNVIINGNGQSRNLKIIIEEDAEVTLKNIKLGEGNVANNGSIVCNGNNTIILSGQNFVKRRVSGNVINIAAGKTLTIEGTDSDYLSLETTNTEIYAGCLSGGEGANIIINGGNISANASKAEMPGIGATAPYNFGYIMINGGTIGATGGRYAAGIGGGNYTSCGDIIINGGTINARGGENCPGIGSGDNGSSCGAITITGGTITATGSTTNCNYDIGFGNGGTGGKVTVSGSPTITTTNSGVVRINR